MELKTKYKPFKEYHNKLYQYNSESLYLERNQWVFKFDNGYGASVICHYIVPKKGVKYISTHGSKEKPFELAVLCNFYEDGYELTYNTPITNDVIGYLTEKEVEEYLEKIENL